MVLPNLIIKVGLLLLDCLSLAQVTTVSPRPKIGPIHHRLIGGRQCGGNYGINGRYGSHSLPNGHMTEWQSVANQPQTYRRYPVTVHCLIIIVMIVMMIVVVRHDTSRQNNKFASQPPPPPSSPSICEREFEFQFYCTAYWLASATSKTNICSNLLEVGSHWRW